jgi:hypothetical protein
LIKSSSAGAIASRNAFMAAIVAVVSLLACGKARADDATGLADLFAHCSGVWQAVSIMEARIGKPISAQRYASLAQAASASANYILAADHGARAGDQWQSGSWDSYVEPRTSGARLQMLTLIDRQDGDRVDQWLRSCAATLETQTEIVKLIRDQEQLSGRN